MEERRQLTEENPTPLPMLGLGPRRKRPSRGFSYTPAVSELSAGRTAIALASAADGGPALDPLGLGVDVREADFDPLRPKRHEPPAHHVEAALAGPGIVADHRERVCWRYVSTGRDVGVGRSGGIDEDELDLADIRGEMGTATHGASISGQGREPKRISASPAPAVTLIPA